MDELLDLDLLPRRIRTNAFTCQEPATYDHLFTRLPPRDRCDRSHLRNSANCKLLQKVEQLRDSRPEKYHQYFNKIIRTVLSGHLDLH